MAETLRRRYRGEYQSYNNMKARIKERGETLHPALATFEAFLEHMKPKRSEQDTLDRIDRDRGYEPDNLRWASKRVQANNRSNTVMLRYTGDGLPEHRDMELPLTEWADLLGKEVTSAMLRGRLERGWSVNETIEGRRAYTEKPFAKMSKAELLRYRPWDPTKASQEERRYREEASTAENPFEFERRVLIREEMQPLLNKLGQLCRWVTDDNTDELMDYPPEHRYRQFILRREEDIALFSKLKEQLEPFDADIEKSEFEEKKWLAALEKHLRPVIYIDRRHEIEHGVRVKLGLPSEDF